MKNKRVEFYTNTIFKLIDNKEASILVVGGGEVDKGVFLNLGYKNVVISNLDDRMDGEKLFHPYKWCFQNAENIDYEDFSFDFVVIHEALHHCHSPHKALLEMYRVASVGVICFESRDNLIIRMAVKLGLTQEYELASVFYNGFSHGGVENTEIPNYIFRWTEREIEKTIKCYAPHVKHQFKYIYGYDFPQALKLSKRRLHIILAHLLEIPFLIIAKILPKHQNLFAFYINKPSSCKYLHTWLKLDHNGKLCPNVEQMNMIYKPKEQLR
ncbi:MAG: hypothetical protein QG641_835 [Candidatus Poribacteria bacterium]|nr:hypothetical protein [Candidatus Poribacteria bacterium]